MGTKIEISLKNYTTKIYEDDQVVSANIFQANDPLCRELQIGTLEVVLYSPTDEFNFLNPDNILNKLDKFAKVVISYVFDDNVEKQLGVYYIDNWKYEKNKQIRLYCIDAIGRADKSIWRGTFMTTSTSNIIYVIRPLGLLFYGISELESNVELKSTCKGAHSLALENGLYMKNQYTPITTRRSIIQSILFATGTNIIIKNDGKPFLFDSSEEYRQGEGYPRPDAGEIIRKNRIILSSNDNDITERIAEIRVPLFVKTEKGIEEVVFNEKMPSYTDKTKYLYGNYVDYVVTQGTNISIASLRSGVGAYNNSSNEQDVIIKAKKINTTSDFSITQYISNGNGSIVEDTMALIDTDMHIRWNSGFIANIEFICNSDMKQLAGYTTKVELEEGKAYPRSNIRIKHRC